MKITQRTIADLTLPDGKAEAIYFDDSLPGFGLRIRAAGSRNYVVQYSIKGRQRRVTLGSTALLKPEQARSKAVELLSKVKLGGDPAGDVAEAKLQASETFAAVVKRFLIRQKGRLRPNSSLAQERYLLNHLNVLHNLPLSRIDRRTIATRLSEIAVENGPSAADQARVHLSTFFSWSMKEGLVDANPVLATNKHATGKARERVLSLAELAAIWRAAPDNAYGTFIKVLMLTGQRRSEVGSLRWDEVDLASRLIRLPAERTKNHRPHEIPLSEPALSLLQAMPRFSTFVFGTSSTGLCGYGAAKAALDERLPPMPHWTHHDIRRSVATGMANIGVLPHVVEAVLNHVSGHKAGVAGVYNLAQYMPQKTDALTRWAEHLQAVVTGATSKIVPLRAGVA
jgi:integrase